MLPRPESKGCGKAELPVPGAVTSPVGSVEVADVDFESEREVVVVAAGLAVAVEENLSSLWPVVLAPPFPLDELLVSTGS